MSCFNQYSAWTDDDRSFSIIEADPRELSEVQKRVRRLEMRFDELTAKGNLSAQIESLSQSVQLLKQSFSELQGRMQQSNEREVSEHGQQSPAQVSPIENENENETVGRDSSSTCKSVTTIGGLASHDLDYEWKESVWDLSVFMATSLMTPGTSVVVFLCLIMNLLLLFLFIVELSTFGIPDFNSETRHDFQIWRSTVAHDVAYQNRITGESLANGVCNKKLYFPVANFQLQMVQEFEAYLDTESSDIPRGVLMCNLSILIWLLIITIEIREVMKFLQGFMRIPIEHCNRFDQDKDEPDKVILSAVSRVRWWLVMILQSTRALVALTLALQGTLFLVVEISVEDMVLNSVALEIILNFDEIIYAALLPAISQRITSRVMPISYGKLTPWQKRWNSWGLFYLLLMMYPFCFVLINWFALNTFYSDVEANLEALCGGEQQSYNFVVAIDAIGMPWAASTPNHFAEGLADTYAYHAIEESIKNSSGFWSPRLLPQQRSNVGMFMQVFSGVKLEQVQRTSKEFKDPKDWELVDPKEYGDIVGWQDEFLVLGNTDFGDVQDTVYNHYLRYLLEKPHEPNVTCADASKDWCFKQGSMALQVIVRQLCPNHCGCASPTTGSIGSPFGVPTRLGFGGCAPFNVNKKSFAEERERLICKDTTSANVFEGWARGAGHAQDISRQSLKDNMLKRFAQEGCTGVAAVKLGLSEDTRICQMTSLPAVCPEACGCNKSIAWVPEHTLSDEFCPLSCNEVAPTPPCLTVHIDNGKSGGTRGPHAGLPCVFPFGFQGRMYNGCTYSGDWPNPWCAVANFNDISYRWGDCSDVCPLDPTEHHTL